MRRWERLDSEGVIVLDFPRFIGNCDRNRIKDLGLTFAAAQKHHRLIRSHSSGLSSISMMSLMSLTGRGFRCIELVETLTDSIAM